MQVQTEGGQHGVAAEAINPGPRNVSCGPEVLHCVTDVTRDEQMVQNALPHSSVPRTTSTGQSLRVDGTAQEAATSASDFPLLKPPSVMPNVLFIRTSVISSHRTEGRARQGRAHGDGSLMCLLATAGGEGASETRARAHTVAV